MAEFYQTVYDVLRDIRTCIRTELAGTPDGDVADISSGLIPGETPWDDCCGQLTLTVTRIGYSQTFPVEISAVTNNCALPYVVVSASATLLRCMPGMSDSGKPPSNTTHDAAMLTWLRDAQAVLSGVACCLNIARDANTILQYSLGAVTPSGASGGCIGIVHDFQLGLANVLCCA